MSVVSLPEVKADLQITTTDVARDTVLQGKIDAAEAALARHVGALQPAVRTDVVVARNGVITLPRTPATGLAAVAGSPGGAAVDVSNVKVDARTGIVTFLSTTLTDDGLSTGLSGAYAVTYTYGWPILPRDLRDAVKSLVRYMWRPQRGGDQEADVQVLRTGVLAQTPSEFPPDVQMIVDSYTEDELGFA